MKFIKKICYICTRKLHDWNNNRDMRLYFIDNLQIVTRANLFALPLLLSGPGCVRRFVLATNVGLKNYCG